MRPSRAGGHAYAGGDAITPGLRRLRLLTLRCAAACRARLCKQNRQFGPAAGFLRPSRIFLAPQLRRFGQAWASGRPSFARASFAMLTSYFLPSR